MRAEDRNGLMDLIRGERIDRKTYRAFLAGTHPLLEGLQYTGPSDELRAEMLREIDKYHR